MDVQWGEVTDDSPLTVQFNGESTGTPVSMKSDLYTPVVGDTVMVVKVGDKWVAVCDIEAA